MQAPTLYRLLFKRNCCNEYDVSEQHRCQDKGCFWTDEQFIDTCIPGNEAKFVEEYNNNLIEGIVDEVEIEYIEVER